MTDFQPPADLDAGLRSTQSDELRAWVANGLEQLS